MAFELTDTELVLIIETYNGALIGRECWRSSENVAVMAKLVGEAQARGIDVSAYSAIVDEIAEKPDLIPGRGLGT